MSGDLDSSRLQRMKDRAVAYFGFDNADPFRSLPKPDRRRVGLAVLVGRPGRIPEHLVPLAAAHARRYRWWSWMGYLYALVGIADLAVGGLGVGGRPPLFMGAGFVVLGGFWLAAGWNFRRMARLAAPPPGARRVRSPGESSPTEHRFRRRTDG